MIRFHNVRWQNFLSSGNTWTEIQLDRSPNTLVIGENGAGKSTMLDALCFSLFGRPFRKINIPQLVNSLNEKECLVEVEFETGGDTYLIRRGLKPKVFEVFKNNDLVDIKTWIEDAVAGKQSNCWKRMQAEWTTKLMNDDSFTDPIPSNQADFVTLVTGRDDYKNRKERDEASSL